jgi:hypothetical protein
MHLIFTWLMLTAAVIGAQSSRDTLTVVGFTPGRSLRDDGWKERKYNKPVSWKVVQGPDGPVLHGTSDGSASTLYKGIEKYDAREYPIIQWRWKVVKLPRKGKENNRANDDYGARVYVFFPGWTFLTSYVLEYVWDNETPVGTVKGFFTSARCKFIVVNSGTKDLGKWVSVERNLWEDYKRAFGRAPDRLVGGIGFMSDSDNTSSSAEAYYGPVRIMTPP